MTIPKELPSPQAPPQQPPPSAFQKGRQRLLNWLGVEKIEGDRPQLGDGSGDGKGNGKGNPFGITPGSGKGNGGGITVGGSGAGGKGNGAGGNGKGGGGNGDGLGGRGGEPPKGEGSGDGPPDNSETPPYWIPICFLVPPEMPTEAVNENVKANADSYGACGIAMRPFVFRVKFVPNSADQINALATQVCPLNQEFKVGGAAVQTFAPYPKTADEMCGSYENGKLTEEVAGCSVLGNGNSGQNGVSSQLLTNGAGFYGKSSGSGGPATSIVDSTANYSPGVSCHELGHSNGEPGRGGDYLVNVGDGKQPNPAQGGMGLEAQTAQGGGGPTSRGGGREGAGLGNKCEFTNFGCASLRGGSNPNDRKFKWDKQRKVYFWEKPGTPPKWDLLSGRNFFRYTEPPPNQPPKGNDPPKDRGGDLVLKEGPKSSPSENSEITAGGPTSGHKKGAGVNIAVNTGSDSSISSIRRGTPRGTSLSSNSTRSSPPIIPKGGKESETNIVLRETPGSSGSSSGGGSSIISPTSSGDGGSIVLKEGGLASGNSSVAGGSSTSSGDSSSSSRIANGKDVKGKDVSTDDTFWEKTADKQGKRRRIKGAALRPNQNRVQTRVRASADGEERAPASVK